MSRQNKPTDIGKRLRLAIEAKGMKHSWLANEAGITPATLSNILTGRTSDPSLSVVMALADAIGEPLGALLGERSESLLESEHEVLRQAIEILGQRVLHSRVNVLSAAASAHEQLSEAEVVPRHDIPSVLHRRGARMVFRVIGDSLAEEGIRDGDILYVRPASDVRASSGHLVICRVDDAVFARKLVATARGIRLHSRSSFLSVSTTETFELIGVVVAHLAEL